MVYHAQQSGESLNNIRRDDWYLNCEVDCEVINIIRMSIHVNYTVNRDIPVGMGHMEIQEYFMKCRLSMPKN